MQASSKPPLSNEQIEEAARFFSILSEPSRLKILRALMQGPLTVGRLVEATGLQQGNVSKHLGVLLTARCVAREKEGNFARYSIADRYLFQLCDLVCDRMVQEAHDRLRALTGTAQLQENGRFF